MYKRQERVQENIAAINDEIAGLNPDVVFLQEVDRNSMITLPCICLLYHIVNPLGAMISIDPSLVRLTLLSLLSASTAQSESFVWAVIICGKMHKRLIRRNLIIDGWFYSVDMRRGLP